MSIISSLKNKITEYAEAYIKLIKLNIIGKTANLMSYFMFAIICTFMLFGIIILLGFGITELFCSLGLSKLASIFITIGINVILLATLIGFQKKITRFFAGAFIKALTDDEESETNKD